jgi:hypothetical protein
VPPRPTRPDRPRQLGSQFRNGDRSKQNFKDERRTQPTLRPVLVLATHTHWVPNSSSTSTRNSSGTLKTTRPLAIGSALTSAYDFIMHCAIGDAFACGNNAKNAIVPTRTLRMFILPDGRVFCDHHVRQCSHGSEVCARNKDKNSRLVFPLLFRRPARSSGGRPPALARALGPCWRSSAEWTAAGFYLIKDVVQLS